MPFTLFKARRVQKTEVKLVPKTSVPVQAEYSAPFVFTPLDQRPGLLPLGVAQKSPEIVYRSLELLDKVVEFRQAQSLKLVSLKEAQETNHIKRRNEGFEIEEVNAIQAKWAAIWEFVRLDSELPGNVY
ncbi:hypothetical protein QCA50_020088 [Cerrena zonata]|uniref:Uncharacterized protein n=1 Tax=Cerrena zonata TaxID=2478898 RepID=A0AAW0FDB6_9APHY